jgi:hypothetical protein
MKVGDYFSSDRNSAGLLIDTVVRARLARNCNTPSKVDFPLSGSGEVTRSKGLCVLTSVNIAQSAGTIARFSSVAT